MSALAPALAVLLLLASPAAAEEESVVREVLAILHARGLVDDAEYADLASRHERWTARKAALAQIEWSGDFRARYEQFWFNRDPLGVDRSDRSRGRYRLRLQGRARINPWADVTLRLASGGRPRSANQTFGAGDDFDPDGLFIDRAHLELRAPETLLPLAGTARLRLGKMGVPFRWKHGPDSMLWDRDLSLEGAALAWDSDDLGDARLFARAAYLIADENSAARDPHLLGLQLGALWEPAAAWQAGGRVTHYEWRSLDPAFLGRAAAAGGLRFGLNGTASGNGGLSATELAAYLRWSGNEDWPVLVYGHVVKNHDAARHALHPDAGEEDLGFGFGLEVGDKRKLAKLEVGFFRLEANAWPGQFTDSPLLDGRANREVIVLKATREVLPSTDLKVALFFGEPVERGSAFAGSLSGAERTLLQTDLVVRF